MDIMREWISQNRKLIPQEDIILVLNDLKNHTVAVKALQVIPITYSLIATVRITEIQYSIHATDDIDKSSNNWVCFL